MSRAALDGFPLGDVEKDFMLDLIRRYSKLYFVEILGFCLMDVKNGAWKQVVPRECPLGIRAFGAPVAVDNVRGRSIEGS